MSPLIQISKNWVHVSPPITPWCAEIKGAFDTDGTLQAVLLRNSTNRETVLEFTLEDWRALCKSLGEGNFAA
jgi:hypothetical protein